MKPTEETCEITEFDKTAVNKAKQALLERNISQTADMIKALADETRLKILYALTVVEELCVCDVAHIIGSSSATASHHLRLLHGKGLAKFRRKGRMVYYSLDDDHVRQLVTMAIIHSEEVSLDGKRKG